MGHIVTGLLEDAKNQTFTAVSQGQTAWHITAWGYTRSITLEWSVNIMRSILTPGAAKAFTQKEVTIPVLVEYLPLYNGRLYARSRLIYATIGRHEDRRIAVYPDSTIDLGRPFYEYKKSLKLVGQGILYQGSMQHVYREMGKQGYNMEFRVLCCMDSSILFI